MENFTWSNAICVFNPTYVLPVLIIGLNITCTKFWILWICTRPTSYPYTISTQNMTRAKWWNTSIAYQHLGTFIRPVRHEEKRCQEKLWIWHAADWASSLVVPTFVTRYAKPPEILAAKDGTICREASPVILNKWPLSRHLGICFWISEPVLVQTVPCLSAGPTAYLRQICAWIMTRGKWWNSFICELHAS